MSLANRYQILVAAPLSIYRDCICALLEAQPDFTVVGRAADGRQALELTRRCPPHILLAELGLGFPPVIELLRQNGKHFPSVRTMVVGAAAASQQMLQFVELGARGVVPHDCSIEVLSRGMRCIMAGDYWIGNERVPDARAYLRRKNECDQKTRRDQFGLTPRELDIVRAIVSGVGNREIAHNYAISSSTVKHHLTSIFGKLGVANRLELALLALERGLVKQVERRTAAAV